MGRERNIRNLSTADERQRVGAGVRELNGVGFALTRKAHTRTGNHATENSSPCGLRTRVMNLAEDSHATTESK